MNSFCIATWNLQNMSPKSARADALRAKIAETQADVWVLTEIREGFDPGKEYHLVAKSAQACDLAPDRRWTAIWVRNLLDGSSLKTQDPQRTACAQLKIPGGFIVNVYGTVLPWRGSTWNKFPGAGGQAFCAALAQQKEDWCTLQTDHPEAWLFVAGDFNQDLLETKHYYSSKIERTALRDTLEQAKLKCLTGGEADPVAQMNPDKASIDHICMGGSVPQISDPVVNAWYPEYQKITLSDHFGVSATVSYS